MDDSYALQVGFAADRYEASERSNSRRVALSLQIPSVDPFHLFPNPFGPFASLSPFLFAFALVLPCALLWLGGWP